MRKRVAIRIAKRLEAGRDVYRAPTLRAALLALDRARERVPVAVWHFPEPRSWPPIPINRAGRVFQRLIRFRGVIGQRFTDASLSKLYPPKNTA